MIELTILNIVYYIFVLFLIIFISFFGIVGFKRLISYNINGKRIQKLYDTLSFLNNTETSYKIKLYRETDSIKIKIYEDGLNSCLLHKIKITYYNQNCIFEIDKKYTYIKHGDILEKLSNYIPELKYIIRNEKLKKLLK